MTTLDASQRASFGELADILIPHAEGMPAATEIDIAGVALDRVLKVRPDLQADLERAMKTDAGDPAAERIADLQKHDPAAFDAVATAATGGYYTDSRVRGLIGYPGQTFAPERLADTITLNEPLIQNVIARGPLYRPTPTN